MNLILMAQGAGGVWAATDSPVVDLIPVDMTPTAMWAVIVGFVSPLVLNFLVNATWPAWAKALAAFGFSALVGTITAVLTGAYEGLGIPSAILLTAVVSISAYEAFWKKVVPNMQRGSAAKAALKAEEEKAKIAAVAAPVAASVASQTVQTVVPIPAEIDDPGASDAVG